MAHYSKLYLRLYPLILLFHVVNFIVLTSRSTKLQKMYGQSAGGGKAPDQMGYETGHVTGYATVQTVPSYAPPPEAGGGWGSSGGGGGWSSGAGWTDAGGWSSGASNHGPGSGSGWSGNGNNGWLGDTGKKSILVRRYR